MKFISKSTNLCVILKPGLPAEPLTGRVAQSGLSVKFEGGLAIVNNQEICDLLMKHPGFNRDFILADDLQVDPYSRSMAEPAHDVINIDYGHPGQKGGSPNSSLSPEIEKILKETAKNMAIEMAKEIAPKMAKELLEQMVSSREEAKKDIKSKSPKVVKEDIDTEEKDNKEK